MEILRKDQLESSLSEEKRLIQDGRLKDPNPLDTSNNFNTLCQACRKGDLKTCQEVVARGVNINARDLFDYTPLILVSAPDFFFLLSLLNVHCSVLHVARRLTVDMPRLVYVAIMKSYNTC